MMKRFSLLAVAAFAVLLSSSLDAGDKIKLKGIKCPVSGKAVKKGTAVEYKGAKVFFCCNNCPKAFKGNKKKYAAKANHQLLATKQAKEVKCPLTGRKLNTDTVIEIAGAKVCFCCNGCKGKATRAKGDEQIELVFNNKAFEKGFKVKKKKKK